MLVSLSWQLFLCTVIFSTWIDNSIVGRGYHSVSCPSAFTHSEDAYVVFCHFSFYLCHFAYLVHCPYVPWPNKTYLLWVHEWWSIRVLCSHMTIWKSPLLSCCVKSRISWLSVSVTRFFLWSGVVSSTSNPQSGGPGGFFWGLLTLAIGSGFKVRESCLSPLSLNYRSITGTTNVEMWHVTC